jgi:fatty-acyl-CoA synthase
MNSPLTHLRFLLRAEQQFGSKIAVIDGLKKWSYVEYGIRCRKLATLLEQMGLSPGGRVAYLAYNTHHLLEAYYGVCLAGGVLVPLNNRLSADNIHFILQDCDAEYIFIDTAFLPLLEKCAPLSSLREIIPIESSRRSTPQDPDQIDPYELLIKDLPGNISLDIYGIQENDAAEIFYTSGTTHHPNGVILTHRNLYLHGLETALAYGTTDAEVQLHTIPLFHVNGWGTPQYVTCAGGTHVMLRHFDPQVIFSLIEKHQITGMSLVPTMATRLLNFPRADAYDFSSMRYVNIGGAPSTPRLVREIEELLGCECSAGYGLTETSPVLTVARLKSHLNPDTAERYELLAKAGCPIPGVELQIINVEGQPLPWNGSSVGEVVVRGDTVAAGYLNAPKENDRNFRNNWFHTGDLATVDSDGYVQIVDRKKDIIISGGENISTIEIEKAILSHVDVLECAVIPVPDNDWGEVPKALIVLRPESSTDEKSILEHCRTCLSSFKCPKSIEFRLDLPKGGTGKILKRLLREEFWKDEDQRVH